MFVWLRSGGARRGLALASFGAILLALASYSSTHSIDFPVYHRAAVKVLHDNYDLYPHAFDEGPLQVDPLGQFLYAPVIAFLFAPLGLLPLQAAAFVFACLKIPAYLYLFWTVTTRMHVQSRAGWLMLASVLITGGYLVEEFRGGNVHIFSVCLIVLAFDRATCPRRAAASAVALIVPAVALALAIALKLSPLMLLPYFAIRRRFAVCAATLVALGIVWAAPALVVGFETSNQLTEAFVRSASRIADRPDNVSLRGVLFRVFTPMPIGDPQNPPNNLADVSPLIVSMVWIALATAIVIGVGIAVWHAPRDEATRLLDLSLLLTTMLVVAPHTQRVHFSALVVAVAVMVALLMEQPHRRFGALIRAALVVTAAASTCLPLLFGGRSASLAYQSWSPYSVATFFLLGTLVTVRLPPSRSALRGPGKPDTTTTAGAVRR